MNDSKSTNGGHTWIDRFYGVVYPDAPHLAMASFNEKAVIKDATTLIEQLQADNDRLKADKDLHVKYANDFANDNERLIRENDNYESANRSLANDLDRTEQQLLQLEDGCNGLTAKVRELEIQVGEMNATMTAAPPDTTRR